MPLPDIEAGILHYLGENKTATAGNVSRDLKMNRSATRKALHGLADSRLVSVDRGTWPASWALTDVGVLSSLLRTFSGSRDDPYPRHDDGPVRLRRRGHR